MHETNTFSSKPTEVADFQLPGCWCAPAASLRLWLASETAAGSAADLLHDICTVGCHHSCSCAAHAAAARRFEGQEAIHAASKGKASEIGGFIHECEARGIELALTLKTEAAPMGRARARVAIVATLPWGVVY